MTVAVPFLDLAAGNRVLEAQLSAAALRVLGSNRFIGGPEVESFEQEFAKYVGANHGIGTGNGLDALILALQAVGVQAGDEVIVPSHTFIATWLAVTRLGATPVPVEPRADTMNIDSTLIEEAITPKTKAIMPVYLYGNPADMAEVCRIAEKHGIPVIADAAQAHGAFYKGQPVGALATSCWSFYPGKNLGAYGDAGGVTTLDKALADKVRKLGNYGSSAKYVHDEPNSTNSRLDPMQAALLKVRLAVVEEENAKRRTIATRYLKEFARVPMTLPVVTEDSVPVWHLFVVRTGLREALQKHLREQGVETLIHYPTAVHKQLCYAELAKTLPPLPLAEQMAAEVLSLPIGPMMTDAQIDHVIEAVKGFFA